MNKSLEITISLEFEGIDDADGSEADEIIQRLLLDMKRWEAETGAAAIWMDDAFIVSGGHEEAA